VTDEGRIAGVDTLRFLGVALVVTGHAQPVLSGVWNDALMHVCRNAVPFFLTAAGYFYGKSLRAGAPLGSLTMKYLKRLVLIFAAWSLLYAAWESARGSAVPWGVLDSLRRGTSAHLWFFPALIAGVLFTAAFLRFGLEKIMLPAAALLYLAGFAFVNATPLRLPLPQDVQWGNGFFFSPLFLAAGYWLSGRRAPALRWALAVWGLGYGIRFVEAVFFWKYYGCVRPFDPALGNYVLAALPMGMGALMFALAKPSFGESTPLPRLGRLTLGIYAGHRLFQAAYPYAGLFPPSSAPLERLFNPIYSLTLAVVLSATLARFKATRGFVS
jgi:surface polysaccharide O-acyltransferase-like enzyme